MICNAVFCNLLLQYFFQLSLIAVAVFSIIVVRIILIESMHDVTNKEGVFFAKYAKLLGTGMYYLIYVKAVVIPWCKNRYFQKFENHFPQILF